MCALAQGRGEGTTCLADSPRIIHAVLLNDAKVGGMKCYQCKKNNQIHLLFGHNKFRNVHSSNSHAIFKISDNEQMDYAGTLRDSTFNCTSQKLKSDVQNIFGD
jgi:hypothetical protein